MLLGAFRGGNPLERIVGKPPTESRRHAVGHKKGLGVLRPSGGANAVAGCWPTYREDLPPAGLWLTLCWQTTFLDLSLVVAPNGTHHLFTSGCDVFSSLLSIVRFVRLLEYISRRGRYFLHEHIDTRCAARSSCSGRCTRLYLGGGTLVGHRNRREYHNLQHRRWAVTSSTSLQRR